ncbi:MAG: hypothetical protein P8R42_05460 [Candidatus Binatia bacterium]|nr:hypothetical protein [Candidatus Binatia bacterium]
MGERDRPPVIYWLLPTILVVLRALPFLHALSLEPDPGVVVLQVGYLPKDFLTYLAFARQAAEDPSLLFHNPFTTEPHTARFILPFFWLLGRLSAWTGVPSTLLLELVRVPLVFLFFGVLWWFLRPILLDRRTRFVAATMIGLSGGLEGFVRPFAGAMPPAAAVEVLGSTSHLLGWSTFAALFNPVWVAGLTSTLVVLRPLLRPHGPTGLGEQFLVSVAFFIGFWIHPYSAIVVLAVAGTYVVAGWIFERRVDSGRLLGIAALAPPLLLLAVISGWQRQDPIYAAASTNVVGPNGVGVFWWPITLGAVVVFALRGAQKWVADEHPYRLALFAWVLAVLLLHSSPVLNGYHFVFHLHLPIAIVAAVGLREALSEWGTTTAAGRVATAALVFALLPSVFFVTRDAIDDVKRENAFPAAYGDVIATLSDLPPGNALVPVQLGNLLPAFTPHRVWVGHWFLTPNAVAHGRHYQDLIDESVDPTDLRRLVDAQSIRYAVLPTVRAARWTEILGDRVLALHPHQELALLILRPS